MNTNINQSSMLPMKCILRGIYRIERYLSSGGFGNTYVATNIEFEETVAIKEFFIRGITQRDANNTTVSVSNSENKFLFDEQLEKFKKEARRLRKLRNEHIVSVHDLFEENGTAYYVMDYIDGENLSDKVKRQGFPLDEDLVMNHYLSQILDALDCIHQKGLWHLDLKPANIMVDRDGKLCLIDFGASKQRSNSGGATSSTGVSYTNGYAPREQMEQSTDKFGPWTDIYALGATLYNLLANRRPPMPSDIDDDRTADKHLALPLPDNLSESTKQLILKMLTTNRLDRPQSVKEVMEMVGQASPTREIPKDEEKTTPAFAKEESDDDDEVEVVVVNEHTDVLGNRKERGNGTARRDNGTARRDNEPVRTNNGPKERAIPDNMQSTGYEQEEKPPLWKKFLVPVIAAVGVAVITVAIFQGKKDDVGDGAAGSVAVEQRDTTPKAEEKKTVEGLKYSGNKIGTFTYTGEVDDNNIPNGQGEAKFDNGDKYNGPFKNGMFNGDDATYTFQTGLKIYGTIKENNWEKGRITYPDGDYFEGTINVIEPYNGTMHFKDGKEAEVKKGNVMK